MMREILEQTARCEGADVVGHDPVGAVQMMNRLLVETEPLLPPHEGPDRGSEANARAHAVAALADDLGAAAVVVSSESEGFGIPVVEAMARGAPVVAAAAGGVPEAADGAALLVPPGDDAALAAALRSLETEPARRDELVAQGLRRAGGCRFADAAARLYQVLAEAAA